MSRRLVARRYAKALLQIGVSQGSLPDLQQELARLRSLVEGHPDLRRLVEHSLFAPSRKTEALDRVLAAAGHSDLVRNFLRVVSLGGRLDHFFEILDAFDAQVDSHLGIQEAFITSAQPLSDTQAESIQASLSARTGLRIRARWTLDPSLLGGLRVQVGSTVYDASLLGQLHQIKIRMLSAPSL